MADPYASLGEATRLIKAGSGPAAAEADAPVAVNPPIQRGSTVILPSAEALYDHSRPTYGRQGLVTHQAVIEGLCALERAEAAFLYPSGAAAVAGAVLALLGAGDELLVADCVYGPTRRFADSLKRFGITPRYFGPRTSAEDLMAMAGPTCRLILLESPGSLTFEVSDVPAIAAAARARGMLTMVDNTWAAGVLFKPLEHGVDLSMQALTKYAAGHADVFMGSVSVRDAALAKRLDADLHVMGWAVSPDDAYQVLRGLRTLPLRIARHGEAGLAVARWLETQPEVARVLHPALPASPDHAIWARDFSGACGLFGAVLQPTPRSRVNAFLDRLKLFGLGFSWGGFESLAILCDPQLTRTAQPLRMGGPLIRLHVGLEDPSDLIADLRQGLDALAD